MEILLQVHSIWRWVLLAVALVVAGKALVGWLGRQPFGQIDDRLGLFYTIAVDIQVLIGLILWIGRGWAAMVPQAMSNDAVRFIAVEHPLLMVLGAAMAHVGRSRSRAASTDTTRHRNAALFYLVSLALILAGIPWDRLGG